MNIFDSKIYAAILCIMFVILWFFIAGGSKSGIASEGVSSTRKAVRQQQQPSQKKDAQPAAASSVVSDWKGGERPAEKERRKAVPPPRMQFDDKSRVEKAKRRALVNQNEARIRVELFRHLPQYEHGTQLPDLEKKFFQLDPVHPAVYKVVLHFDSYLILACLNPLCIALCGNTQHCTMWKNKIVLTLHA